ncbi:MAG: bifunctional riboflavin kinase/FAD synthetase [Megasphaera sp.]|jgi:riboflavin kinase/FMN adenylyltransferase|uniref:bifunctional riboflavin kinase/FAD synthetase n=1 Tax=Megasphaera sueciensis TaxID=349094 RepID=UPI003D0166BF|nr:bifunctional riboflavin kinase/FAD synthetase [Megasphaera sp.]MCI1822764.1 bifunctional riboflavin kinase/FAD synthetase [Megasphaera sp.]
MQVFHSFEEVAGCPNAVIALGTFDGIHLGHQKVMQEAIKKAKSIGGTAVVVTFSAHPFSVLCPQREPVRLATVDQKIRYISDLGIDALILLPMNRALISETHIDFTNRLLKYLKPRGVVVGDNFTYGAKAAGNTATLKAALMQQNIPVYVLPLLETPGRTAPVSSTVIRKAVQLGHMEMAAALLGRAYELEGMVVEGDKRGTTIGFPTANMLIPLQMAIPPDGVYVTEMKAGECWLPAMTNIGANPTFTNQYRRIETHILDWQGQLYGEKVRVRFYKRLRKEVKFINAEDLIHQMESDRRQTLSYFSRMGNCKA